MWWSSAFSKVDRAFHQPWLAMCHWRRQEPPPQWVEQKCLYYSGQSQTQNCKNGCQKKARLYNAPKTRELNAFCLVFILASLCRRIPEWETSVLCIHCQLQCSIYLSHCVSDCQTELLVLFQSFSVKIDLALGHLVKAIITLAGLEKENQQRFFRYVKTICSHGLTIPV